MLLKLLANIRKIVNQQKAQKEALLLLKNKFKKESNKIKNLLNQEINMMTRNLMQENLNLVQVL